MKMAWNFAWFWDTNQSPHSSSMATTSLGKTRRVRSTALRYACPFRYASFALSYFPNLSRKSPACTIHKWHSNQWTERTGWWLQMNQLSLKNYMLKFKLGGCTVLNMYEYTWVHRRGIKLNIAVLRIHTINTFRTEKNSRIFTLNIYLKQNTSVYKGI